MASFHSMRWSRKILLLTLASSLPSPTFLLARLLANLSHNFRHLANLADLNLSTLRVVAAALSTQSLQFLKHENVLFLSIRRSTVAK